MSTATWHINIDRNKETAFIPRQTGKEFEWIEAGTEAGAELLEKGGIDEFNVGHSELVFFKMKRHKDGNWVAHWEGEKSEPEMTFDLGKSRAINYKRIDQAWRYFLKERENR